MKKIFLSAALPAMLLMACNNNNKPVKDNSLIVPAEAAATVVTASPSDTLLTVINPSTDQAVPTTGKTTVQTAPAIKPVSSNSNGAITAALNPAHGQPNHRCDIPVGAPLNTVAQSPATPQKSITPLSNTPVMAQPTLPKLTSTANSGKPNPAHGQPGHDCAIAVGAPLP